MSFLLYFVLDVAKESLLGEYECLPYLPIIIQSINLFWKGIVNKLINFGQIVVAVLKV